MDLVVPTAPHGAVEVFGDRLSLAEDFVRILADTGVSHGLIGPREVPRLWERHVLNCAVIEDSFPEGVSVIDVGSGAGLPGIALAIARPDLRVQLVEPMLRRTTWLEETVRHLGLGNCEVHRGRAEEFAGVLSAPFVTARAVARLDKLAGWCFPLLEGDGRLVALKGRSAAEELDEARTVLTRLGMVRAEVREHGGRVLEEPSVTVELTVDQSVRTKASDRTAPTTTRRKPVEGGRDAIPERGGRRARATGRGANKRQSSSSRGSSRRKD